MSEFKYQKLMSAMQESSGIEENVSFFSYTEGYQYSTGWFGERPIVIKIPIAWKIDTDEGTSKKSIKVLYQAECIHGVRGKRSFQRWSSLSPDHKRESVPECDRCISEIKEREEDEAVEQRLQQRKARRDRWISKVKEFFRKEWKWVIGIVITLATLTIAYLNLVRARPAM